MNRFVQAMAISLAMICGSQAKAAAIAAAEASAHVGQVTTVEGAVAEVHITPKGTELLDFDARFPAEDFTAVIFPSNANQVGDVNHFYGKRVQVTGKIELYKGRPEIIVREPGQLKIVP
jgi:DNA/RNA endonuclease YhcR with UshA esterase domain